MGKRVLANKQAGTGGVEKIWLTREETPKVECLRFERKHARRAISLRVLAKQARGKVSHDFEDDLHYLGFRVGSFLCQRNG